jgi:MFS family permease
MKTFDTNFKLVLISQTISLFGINILRFALLLFILDLTRSAAIFGAVTAITQIPLVVFPMVGGIMADRLNKKKMVVVLDFMKAVMCFILLFVFLTGTYTLTILTTFIFIIMITVTIFTPLLTAATPSIVRDEVLVDANGAIQGINAISDLLGFVLGGILVATIGVVNIILFSGIFFIISTVIDLFIKIPFIKQKKIKGQGLWKMITDDIKVSFLYLKNENPVLLKLSLIVAILAAVMMPLLTVAMPYIVRIGFGASETMLGVSQGTAMTGMLLGGLLAGKLKKVLILKHFHKWVIFSALLVLPLAISVYHPLFPGSYLLPFWIFTLGFMIIMTVVCLINILLMTLAQEKTPTNLLGKVIAFIMMVTSLLTPVGQYVYGTIAQALFSRQHLLFVGVGVIVLVMGLISKKVLS